jgi:hypothetical protein
MLVLLMQRIYKYAIQIDSDDMIYIPSFLKIGSGIQTLLGGYTHRYQDDNMSFIFFSQNKESRLKDVNRRESHFYTSRDRNIDNSCSLFLFLLLETTTTCNQFPSLSLLRGRKGKR